MLQIIAVMLEWLTRISDWVLAPATLILLALAFMTVARSRATLGLMIVAAITGAFLSISLVAIVSGYGSAILRVFRDFGLIETANFLTTLLPAMGAQIANLVPMMITTAVAGVERIDTPIPSGAAAR